jgi:hypothetical protein
MGQALQPFDIGALYSALDDKRNDLGISWRTVADQLWALSSDLNKRRPDHPISPSTLTNMTKNPRISCQHALFMLRWLERTPESFLMGATTGDDERFALPVAGPDRRPNQLPGLRTAKFATGMDLAMRIAQWLGRPAADFVYRATW